MKDVITGTFLEMTKTRRIDKITVKDLVAECGISRQTFYYHFKDIIEVIEWAMKQEVDRALKLSLESKDDKEAFHHIVSSALENYDFLFKLLHSRKREFVEKIMLDCVQTYLKEAMKIKGTEMKLSLSDAEIALQFCSYGIVGLLFENCGDKQADADTLTAQIYRLYELLKQG